jgi:hypothetical protein
MYIQNRWNKREEEKVPDFHQILQTRKDAPGIPEINKIS